ncbi:FAD-dependent oxidoreductase [Novispirillum sp. DQ9]|uniref:FAD-dependent oxidoreductase n=1 Tax=Novispirillum sp. DQ9 TaxID=3398612 RepID=UPI003C7AC1FC
MSTPDSTAGSVCIVGSGPSGLYAADTILRKRPGCAIDIIDRLPTPFGLVRAGVAPDHQGTKNIVRQFERSMTKPGVRFLGNVHVGRDVSYDELKATYDAVILALGAPVDRTLGIAGEDLDGVHGSGAFVGWYNGHPDHAALAPRLDAPGVAVIGNGNVALDIARILAKTPAEMAGSDICSHAVQAIAAAPLTDIYVLGRRGPLEASFTSAELAELGHLERARPVVDAAALDGVTAESVADPREQKVKEKNLEILREFAARDDDKPLRVHLLFNAAPKEILGSDGRVSGLRVERTRIDNGRAIATGETYDLAVGAVMTAIGYRIAPIDGVPMDEARGIVANQDGLVEDGVYVVGWAKRGPSGVIPSNRSDSMAVAELVLGHLEAAAGKAPGPTALDALLAGRGVVPVCFDDWQKINAAEVARAGDGRPREKFTTIADMLAAVKG